MAVEAGLVAALARCQAKFPPIVKSHTNPAFKGSQYADVADVLAAVRPVLAAEGIVVTQSTKLRDDGIVVLETLLTCDDKDDQFDMSSEFPLHVEGLTAQQVGSLLTYHRRYQLCALLGVHPVGDDDDGNLAATAQRAEPDANEGHRAEVRDLIAELEPANQELVKLEIRNQKIPSLKSPGATLSQLNGLRDFIDGLKARSEPFETVRATEETDQGERDKPAGETLRATEPEKPPFRPVVADPLRTMPPGVRQSIRRGGN